MPFTQSANYSLLSSAPEAVFTGSWAGRGDDITSLRENAAEILRKLRRVRETWSDHDAPPAQEQWVLRQILQCLVISRNPPAEGGFDHIVAASQALFLLIDLPSDAFAADGDEDHAYDLVDFDADLDDAESLLTGQPVY